MPKLVIAMAVVPEGVRDLTSVQMVDAKGVLIAPGSVLDVDSPKKEAVKKKLDSLIAGSVNHPTDLCL